MVFIWYARRRGLPLTRLLDAVVAPLALAQALGRFGCFSAGCCYGIPVAESHPLAVHFTHPQAIAASRFAGQPLLAVQLIEAVFDLALAGLLTWLWRRKPQPEGTVLWCYLLLYSGARLTIEFFRGDVPPLPAPPDRPPVPGPAVWSVKSISRGLWALAHGRSCSGGDKHERVSRPLRADSSVARLGQGSRGATGCSGAEPGRGSRARVAVRAGSGPGRGWRRASPSAGLQAPGVLSECLVQDLKQPAARDEGEQCGVEQRLDHGGLVRGLSSSR